MFVHFAICNTEHNPPKIYKIYFQKEKNGKKHFSIFVGSQIQLKMSFMVLEIWLLPLEKLARFFRGV